MTVLTAAPHADLSPGGMVEVRTPDGKMIGYFVLSKPDYGPELSEEEKRRRLDWTAPNGIWHTA